MTDQAADPPPADPLDPRFAGETLAVCADACLADPDGVGYAIAAAGIDGADPGPVATEAESGVQLP